MLLDDDQIDELEELFSKPDDSITQAREMLSSFKAKHGIGGHLIVTRVPFAFNREKTKAYSPFVELYSRQEGRHALYVICGNMVRTEIIMSYGLESEFQRQRRIEGEPALVKHAVSRLHEIADALERNGPNRLLDKTIMYLEDFVYDESELSLKLSLRMHGILGG
jgi:hypothetical protein